MLNSTAIKRLHCAVTTVLLLLVGGYVAYQFYFNGAPDDELFSQRQITESTHLYVTKYKGGGATVSDVYRYYLDGDLRGDPMPYLKSRTPFLVADVGDAKVTGYGNNITVTMTGRVYSYTNSVFFTADNMAILPVVNITANGVR
jgi:hypothetical protein